MTERSSAFREGRRWIRSYCAGIERTMERVVSEWCNWSSLLSSVCPGLCWPSLGNISIFYLLSLSTLFKCSRLSKQIMAIWLPQALLHLCSCTDPCLMLCTEYCFSLYLPSQLLLVLHDCSGSPDPGSLLFVLLGSCSTSNAHLS